MANSFSNSRHKVLKVLLISAVSVAVLFLSLELTLTLKLNQSLNKAKASCRSDAGLNLDYSLAIFDIFTGVFIKDLSLKQDNNKIFEVSGVYLKLDLVNTLLKRKVLCKKAMLENAHLYRVEKLDKAYLAFLLTSLKNSQEVLKSALVQLYNFNFMELVQFDIGGYVALAQGKVFLSRGQLRILKSTYVDKTNFDQSNSLLDAPLDYAFEATYLNGDFVINKLDLLGFSARMNISGRINDYQGIFDLDFKGELKDLMLEDVKQLNNEYIYARGILNSKFSVKGPLENSLFRTDVNISNTSLRIMGFLKLEKLNSDLVWDNSGFKSQNISGFLDNKPVNVSINIVEEGPKKLIGLEFFSQKLDVWENLKVSFQGVLDQNSIGGDLLVSFDHLYDKKTLSKTCNFKNLFLTFAELGFKCDSAQIELGEKAKEASEQKAPKNVVLENIHGDMAIMQDSLEFYNVDADLFGGKLKADGSFKGSGKALQYNAKVILSDLKSEEAMRRAIADDLKLSGVLSGTIILNSKLRENLSGDIQIVDGQLQDNAILIAISEFFGIPSLRSVAFSNLKIIFYKIWNQYDAKISLFSPQVAIYLDNKSFVGESLDGYLLVKLDTVLTDESPRFKRLFKYIGYKEPTVYFPFQLKGYVGKPRIEWLANEFKEKLQEFLPASNQKLLQEALNKMVVDFSE